VEPEDNRVTGATRTARERASGYPATAGGAVRNFDDIEVGEVTDANRSVVEFSRGEPGAVLTLKLSGLAEGDLVSWPMRIGCTGAAPEEGGLLIQERCPMGPEGEE